jgi:LPXTG-motif cell wall-anchored protein
VRTGLGKRVFGAVGGLLLCLGMISVCLTIYLHISEGRGAEPVQNYLGQTGTSASSAAGIIAGSLMLLIGGLAVAWQRWRRRVWKRDS